MNWQAKAFRDGVHSIKDNIHVTLWQPGCNPLPGMIEIRPVLLMSDKEHFIKFGAEAAKLALNVCPAAQYIFWSVTGHNYTRARFYVE